MVKVLKIYGYVMIVAIFAIFNFILLNSLKEDKTVEEVLKPKIVLICHVSSNPYWQYVKMGAERAAEERNAVIEFVGPDNASAEEGIKLINMAYAAKASGIIAYVQQDLKYNSVINKIIDSGIPIVTIDSDAENSNRLAYIGTDNIEAGKISAEEMISKIGSDGKVAVIMGGSTVKNQLERLNGFTNYININSSISLVDIQSSDSYPLEAELAAKKILKAHSDLKALLCTSAQDGAGAAKIVNALGMTGKIKIICFDDLPETLKWIEDGVITSTIVQNPYKMGYNAVNVMMDNLNGKETKGKFFTDVFVVGKNNLEKYLVEKGESNIESQ